jgi:hypothetical protein
MPNGEGERCETCYGSGEVPTDEGLVTCPDCGGSGTLASPATLVEWRVRAIERTLDGRNDETAQDLRWLAFEVRRNRTALTELLSLIADLDESSIRTRMLFVANGALSLYKPVARKPWGPET